MKAVEQSQTPGIVQIRKLQPPGERDILRPGSEH